MFTKYDLQNPEFTSHVRSEACVQNHPEPSDPVESLQQRDVVEVEVEAAEGMLEAPFASTKPVLRLLVVTCLH